MAVPRQTSSLATSRPSQAAPLTAQAGSQPISPWLQFFIALWTRTGSQAGVDAAALQREADNTALLQAMGQVPVTKSVGLPIVLTVSASPFAYQAPFGGLVVINGGTVSAITMKRGLASAVTFPTGIVPVAKGDVVSVTYSGLPTMTMVGL